MPREGFGTGHAFPALMSTPSPTASGQTENARSGVLHAARAFSHFVSVTGITTALNSSGNDPSMKRTALNVLILVALAGCSGERSPQQVVAEELVRESQRQMAPVQEALNQSLTDWGEKLAQDEAERKERLRRAGEGEPVRSCVIDGVKTFDNRGNLCPC